MRLTILGSGSSGGVPRVGNDWGVCDPKNPKNRRRRCALLVEQFGEKGCTTVLIDTGPDLREQMIDSGTDWIDAAVFTHEHADHLHGIDDLRGFYMKSRKRVPVYMNRSTYDRAYSAFSYCFETPQGSSYPPILDFHEIENGACFQIDGAGGPIRFEPVEVEHGDINALGFRIGDAAYIPDVKDISSKSLNKLEKLDYLILDCLRRSPHPSHFCLDEALEWTARIAPRKAIFTNLHNDLDYDVLKSELPHMIEPAYDGMVIDVELHQNSDKRLGATAYAG